MRQLERSTVIRLVFAASVLVLLSLAVVMIKSCVERESLLRELSSADETDRVRIVTLLSQSQDPRVAVALLELEPSEWEVHAVVAPGALSELLSGDAQLIASRSPAVYGLRALGAPAVEPLIRKLKDVSLRMDKQTGPVPVVSTRVLLLRSIGGLSGIQAARQPLLRLWETSSDEGERAMAIMALSWMEHPDSFDEELRRISASPEGHFLRSDLLERVAGPESEASGEAWSQ